MTRVWILVQGLTVFVQLAVIQGGSETATHCAFETPRCEGGKVLPPLPQYSGWRYQSECAQQVVNRLVRRDLIGPHIEYGQVDLDSKYRIRVFFALVEICGGFCSPPASSGSFRPGMAGGRYASSYGRDQCGMEIHLNPDDPTRTVNIDSRDPSDVDEHEPPGIC